MSEVLTLAYSYTAKDLAAVRAYVQRVAPAIIARTYCDPDEDAFAADTVGDGPASARHARWLSQSRDRAGLAGARGPLARVGAQARRAETDRGDVPDGDRSGDVRGGSALGDALDRSVVSP